MDKLLSFLKTDPALVVSICALVLTSFQMWATRKHNRLTVQPHLATFTMMERDPADSNVVTFKATLSNNGLGPAIIKKFEVLLDGEPVPVTEPDELYPVVAKALTGQLVPEKCRFAILRKHHVMAKDTDVDVAAIAIKGGTPEQLAEVKRFHLRVAYTSAYGQSFTYDSRKHKDEA